MIYDLLPYNGERDILNIRLHELYDSVDFFVICQSEQTISGMARPIYPVRDQFPQFKKKIVSIYNAPSSTVKGSLWEREWFQRGWCKDHLPKLSNKDFLIYSDVDEIPDVARLEEAKEIAFEKGYCGLQMQPYYYYLNVKHGRVPVWDFPVMYHGPVANDKTARQLRWDHVDKDGKLLPGQPHISNAGWHFTYMGGTQQVIKKISSFAHAKDKGVDVRIAAYQNGTEPIDYDIKEGIEFTTVPIDSTFPRYVQENFNALSAVGFIKL